MLKDSDMSLSTAFDDMRRSTGLERLAAMIALEVVTDEELNQFSASTRESADMLADSFRRTGTRRNTR
jgi:maleate cis-trans isomerase